MGTLNIKLIIVFLVLLDFLKADEKKDKELKLLKNKRPGILDDIAFCSACKFLTHNALIKLNGSRKEIDIISILNDKLCKPENFESPMRGGVAKKKVIYGCLSILDIYDGYLEELFIKRSDNHREVMMEICAEKTEICATGIDRRKYPDYKEGDPIDKSKLEF